MIPKSQHARIRNLWPIFYEEGRRHLVDGRLLLALGWLESGLESGSSPAGRGKSLMGMTARTARRLALLHGFPEASLSDARTAVRLAALQLVTLLRQWDVRRALACFITDVSPSPANRTPHDPRVMRYVRHILTLWRWLCVYLPELLVPADAADDLASGLPMSVPADDAGADSILAAETVSTMPTYSSAPASWRLVSAADAHPPRSFDASAVPLLQGLAADLCLRFIRDDARCTVYLGMAEPPRAPALPRLLVPPVLEIDPACVTDAGDALHIFVPPGTPVVAVGSGAVVMSGPSRAGAPEDVKTVGLVLQSLDRPVYHEGRSYRFAWYSHLSCVRFRVMEDEEAQRVHQGEVVGWSGRHEGEGVLRFAIFRDNVGPGDKPLPGAEIAARLGWEVSS